MTAEKKSAKMSSSSLNESQKLLLDLFNKSILKKAKLNAISNFLPDLTNKVCLDIGGDNGVICYLLRDKGGKWYSGDLDNHVVESIRSMVGDRVYQLSDKQTPFDEASFDLVVIIDFLEHIDDDQFFIEELQRIIKPGGHVIINVPHHRPNAWIRKLRLAIGLSDEKHGHVRPGYTLSSLESLLNNRFDIVEHKTYSRFFVELYDAIISFIFEKISPDSNSAKGTVVTAQDLKGHKKKFKLFTLIYPFVWILSQLDKLLFFMPGYSLIINARKTS